MYCSNCGNKIEKEDNFCTNCSKKTSYNKLNNEGKNIKDKFNNYFDKKIDEYLKLFEMLTSFTGTLALHFSFMLFSIIDASFSASPESGGWIVILAPFLIAIYLIPQFVGYVIELINKRKKSHTLSIILFIASCLTLVSVIAFRIWVENIFTYAILIIHSSILIAKYLKKMN